MQEQPKRKYRKQKTAKCKCKWKEKQTCAILNPFLYVLHISGPDQNRVRAPRGF